MEGGREWLGEGWSDRIKGGRERGMAQERVMQEGQTTQMK